MPCLQAFAAQLGEVEALHLGGAVDLPRRLVGMMPISAWVAAKARSTSSHLRTWLVSEKIAANAGDE